MQEELLKIQEQGSVELNNAQSLEELNQLHKIFR